MWPSGLRLVTERVPDARTVALGLWFTTGSRHEPAAHRGITHLLEHMFFKGTPRHTTRQLALAMNALGGHFNAHTSQETICLHARVTAEHLERALRLLAEMARESTLDADELDRERSVVLEEIKMVNDTPEELVHDLFHECLWGNHPLGRPILGTPKTVRAIGRDDLAAHLTRALAPPRLVVAAAGAVEPESLADLVEEWLGDLPADDAQPLRDTAPTPCFEHRHIKRRLEQTNLCLGTLAPHRTADDRHAVGLLHSILGAGFSSRIFQEVRERRGLAYSIETFFGQFRDTGCFGVSGGTSPGQLREVVDLSLRELRRVCDEPIPADELENVKDQARAHLVLGLESVHSRMGRLADVEMLFDRYISPEETLARIEAITPDDLLDAAQRHLRGASLAAVTIGPGAAPQIPVSI